MDWAKADLKHVEERIEANEQVRREAARVKEPPELFAAIDKEIDWLVHKKSELRSFLHPVCIFAYVYSFQSLVLEQGCSSQGEEPQLILSHDVDEKSVFPLHLSASQTLLLLQAVPN